MLVTVMICCALVVGYTIGRVQKVGAHHEVAFPEFKARVLAGALIPTAPILDLTAEDITP